MDIIRSGDVDHVDVIPGDEFAPIRFYGFVTPFFCEGLGVFLVTGADRFKDRLLFEVEKVFDLREGVGVRAAHEAVSYESYS